MKYVKLLNYIEKKSKKNILSEIKVLKQDIALKLQQPFPSLQ